MEFDTKANKITGRNQSTINALKRSYSKEVVRKAAKKNGWMVQTKSETQYVALKY